THREAAISSAAMLCVMPVSICSAFPVMTHSIERAFVPISTGRVHVAACGAGQPILLLHQTPRSWDEYRDVLPLLGKRYRAIAMDTVGFGDSDALPSGQDSIEAWAAAAHEVLAALGCTRAVVAGHHTGAGMGVEMAAARPERVEALILSACPYVDAARRARAPAGKAIDQAETRPDGSHLLELWAIRQAFYPQDRGDLLERFIVDALKAGPR